MCTTLPRTSAQESAGARNVIVIAIIGDDAETSELVAELLIREGFDQAFRRRPVIGSESAPRKQTGG